MDKAVRRVIWLAVLAPAATALEAENASFDLILEAPGSPEFGANPVLRGEVGQEVIFSAAMTLATAGVDGQEGPQGWSCGLSHLGAELISFTPEGTVSAPESEGGLLDRGSFIQYEVVDPAQNGGRQGVIQAVVLSFVERLTLPPNTRQLIGRSLYRARITERGGIACLRYADGLVGSGQPIDNAVTLFGGTVAPALGCRGVMIGDSVPAGAACCESEPGAGCSDALGTGPDSNPVCLDARCLGRPPCPPLEVCDDGSDNDRDLKTDCEDPDCRVDPACRAPEDCDDGADNDGDLSIDCEDFDCNGVAPCPAFEVCWDGIDNDQDALVDCEDPDCPSFGGCESRSENCRDGVDNDVDGRIDCDDPECFGVRPCPGRELCEGGLDEDADGLVDCDDPDCARTMSCRSGEVCQDGVDNDFDGLVDCEDLECAGRPPCPPRELCENGLDEDGDGLVDCDDPSCDVDPACGFAGGGFEFVLFAPGTFREDPEPDGAGGGTGQDAAGTNLVEVPFGQGRTLEVTVYIVPYPDRQPSGAQGWTLSVAHDKNALDFSGATTEGTDAAPKQNGGLEDGGYEQTEEARGTGGGAGSPGRGIDPPGRGAGSDDADGFVSAAVLSFRKPVTLDPSRAHSVARATYLVKDTLGSPGLPPASIRFQDGLAGSGQPVTNLVTIEGVSVQPIHLIPLEVLRDTFFIRGDANGDGKLDIADPIWCLNELVRGGPPTLCRRAADANGDERYDVSDPVFIIQYLFLDGPTVPWPFPRCGGPMGETGLPCPEGSVSFCP